MVLTIGEAEMHDIASGAAILGTGGGGDPYVGKLMALTAIRKHGPVKLLDPTEVPDDWFVIPTAIMGAPTVLIERIPRGDEAVASLRLLEKYHGRKADATMPIEAGGGEFRNPLPGGGESRPPPPPGRGGGGGGPPPPSG